MPTQATFVLFGPAHLWAVALIVVVAVTLPLAVRRLVPSAVQPVALVLFVLMVVQEALGLALKLGRLGPSAEVLPLHLCSMAVFATVWTLVTRSPRAFELAYFWALAGTTQALATPDLRAGFPDPAFLAFFAGHGFLIVGVLYATLALGLRPTPMSIVRVALTTLVLAVLVFGVNLALGTNFFYLMAKPPGASLLDWFGPWPWYWLGLVGASLASFAVLYAPFFVLDRLDRGRRAARPAASAG